MKPVFSEVIKIKDGKWYSLPLHEARMRRTAEHFYGIDAGFDIAGFDIPRQYREGLVKCRLLYGDTIFSVEFSYYEFRPVGKLRVVRADDLDYGYKYADRTVLDKLVQASSCDEILIVRNGYITDTSYTNIVFENRDGLFTPSEPLLRGTKREALLKSGIISERQIKSQEVWNYDKLYFINAMIDIEDCLSVAISPESVLI